MLEARGIGGVLSGRSVLSDISLMIRPGEMVALLGVNGAGKTTLMRLLAGLLPPSAGQLLLDGAALDAISPEARAKRIVWLPQTPDIHWPISVERLVMLGRLPYLKAFRREGEADLEAVARAIEATGVGGFRTRPVTSLSAGERARVLLARALATDAPLLLADEPVAALDPAQGFRMLELLQREAQRGRGVLAVLHDLSLAARFFSRILLLHDGKLLADGPPGRVLSDEHIARVFGIRVHRGGGFIAPVGPVTR